MAILLALFELSVEYKLFEEVLGGASVDFALTLSVELIIFEFPNVGHEHLVVIFSYEYLEIPSAFSAASLELSLVDLPIGVDVDSKAMVKVILEVSTVGLSVHGQHPCSALDMGHLLLLLLSQFLHGEMPLSIPLILVKLPFENVLYPIAFVIHDAGLGSGGDGRLPPPHVIHEASLVDEHLSFVLEFGILVMTFPSVSKLAVVSSSLLQVNLKGYLVLLLTHLGLKDLHQLGGVGSGSDPVLEPFGVLHHLHLELLIETHYLWLLKNVDKFLLFGLVLGEWTGEGACQNSFELFAAVFVSILQVIPLLLEFGLDLQLIQHGVLMGLSQIHI
jgi:hypothetical protein